MYIKVTFNHVLFIVAFWGNCGVDLSGKNSKNVQAVRILSSLLYASNGDDIYKVFQALGVGQNLFING